MTAHRAKPKPVTIDAYLAALPEALRARGEAVRAAILSVAPGVPQSIRYDMPAFHFGGRSYLYFAVWKAHVGLYPIYGLPDDLEARVAGYRAKTDTVQFMHKHDLPAQLIADLARHKICSG